MNRKMNRKLSLIIMGMKYYLTQERSILICFFLSVFAGIGVHFIAVLPSALFIILVPLSLAAGYAGLVLFCIPRIRNLNRNRLLFLWLGLAFYMLCNGILMSRGRWLTSEFGYWLILQDLRYIMYCAIGFALADKRFVHAYRRLMKQLGIIAIVFGIIALAVYPFDMGAIAYRIGGWDWPYFLWWVSASIFAYHFSYSRITGRDRLIGYGTFAAYVILGLLFLKRSVIINALFLIGITLFLKPNGNRPAIRRKVLIAGGTSLILLFTVFLFWNSLSDLIDNTYAGKVIVETIKRFSVDSIFSYDRAVESGKFFATASAPNILFGMGIGNYQVIDGNPVNALHIGLYNILYKGGIFYALFWGYILFHAGKKLLHRKQLQEYDLVCLCVTLSAFLSLLYEFSFTYTILPFGYATSMAYIIQEKGEV